MQGPQNSPTANTSHPHTHLEVHNAGLFIQCAQLGVCHNRGHLSRTGKKAAVTAAAATGGTVAAAAAGTVTAATRSAAKRLQGALEMQGE